MEQAGVPVEREATPGEVALRDVEAEQDEDRDGDEQEDVDQQGVGGQQPVALAMHGQPRTSRRRVRMTASEPMMVTAMSSTPSADPAGQSRRAEELVLDDLGDGRRLCPAQDVGRHEVADGGDEGQDRGGHDARHRQRQRDVDERRSTAGIEVARRGDQGIVETVDGHEERQDGEGQEAVGHAQHDGQVGVEQDDRLAGDAEGLEDGVRDPVVTQDDHPGVGPDEVAGPEGQHHQDQQERLVAAAVARDPIGDGVADGQAQDGRQRRIPEGIPDRRQEDRIERLDVVVDAQAVEDDATEAVVRAEADDADDPQRDQEEECQPGEAWQGQRTGAEPSTHPPGARSSEWRTCRGRRPGRAAPGAWR